jgi:hypothetical protein
VILIEPRESLRAQLERMAETDDRVTVVGSAVGSTKGRGTLKIGTPVLPYFR